MIKTVPISGNKGTNNDRSQGRRARPVHAGRRLDQVIDRGRARWPNHEEGSPCEYGAYQVGMPSRTATQLRTREAEAEAQTHRQHACTFARERAVMLRGGTPRHNTREAQPIPAQMWWAGRAKSRRWNGRRTRRRATECALRKEREDERREQPEHPVAELPTQRTDTWRAARGTQHAAQQTRLDSARDAKDEHAAVAVGHVRRRVDDLRASQRSRISARRAACTQPKMLHRTTANTTLQRRNALYVARRRAAGAAQACSHCCGHSCAGANRAGARTHAFGCVCACVCVCVCACVCARQCVCVRARLRGCGCVWAGEKAYAVVVADPVSHHRCAARALTAPTH